MMHKMLFIGFQVGRRVSYLRRHRRSLEQGGGGGYQNVKMVPTFCDRDGGQRQCRYLEKQT